MAAAPKLESTVAFPAGFRRIGELGLFSHISVDFLLPGRQLFRCLGGRKTASAVAVSQESSGIIKAGETYTFDLYSASARDLCPLLFDFFIGGPGFYLIQTVKKGKCTLPQSKSY